MMFRLTKKLQPYVQRKDESVLRALLPPKEELCIFVRCGEPQLNLYRALMSQHENICEAARGEGGEGREKETCKCKHLLAFHAVTQKLVNHPDALYSKWIKQKTSERKAAAAAAASASAQKAEKCGDVCASALKGAADDLLTPHGCVFDRTPATTLAAANQGVASAKNESCSAAGSSCEEASLQKALLKDFETPSKGQDVEMKILLEEDSKDGSVVLIDDDSKDASLVCPSAGAATVAAGGELEEVEAGDVDEELGEDDEIDKEIVKDLGLAWADEVFGADYNKGVLEMSGKMCVLMEIIREAKEKGHKTLVFSQYRTTLEVIEDFIKALNLASRKQTMGSLGDVQKEKAIRYQRFDGQTAQKNRQSMVNSFNSRSNEDVMLISTKAGGLGLNIPSASRVVLVDCGWNPAHEAQAAVRAYRIGQKNPVFVYRLIATGTMENFVYDRQVEIIKRISPQNLLWHMTIN
jgi:SNF2 family DNA or RNA helicase